MQEPHKRHEQEASKDGAYDAAHSHLLLLADEGRGYDVSHQQEVDHDVEGQVGNGILVLVQKILTLEV